VATPIVAPQVAATRDVEWQSHDLSRCATVQLMHTPENLRYSSDHEWLRTEATDIIRLGITDYAQDALGDVVYVEMPDVGAKVEAGQPFAEVESTKSVSDIFSPVTGEIVATNTDLVDNPERINTDPYGEGWLCDIRLSSQSELDDLMDASAYIELTEA